MSALNTQTEYGFVARAYHWVVAVLMLAMVTCGLAMVALDNGTVRDMVYMLHKTVGMSVLVLALFRVYWRKASPPPPLQNDLHSWELRLAKIIHRTLLTLTVLMPVTGLGMVWFAGNIVEYYVELNQPGAPSPLMFVFGAMHKFLLPYMFILAVLLHIAGLAKHVFIDQDSASWKRLTGDGAN